MGTRVQDKVCIVIGGGNMPGEYIGNGRASAILLAREGAKVMVTARHLGRAQETVDMIKAEGGEAFAYEMDSTDEQACLDMAKKCVEVYGRIDVMFYNAGIVPNEDSGFYTTSLETWERVFNVNLTGAWLASRAVIPYFQEQGWGNVIFNSSMASKIHGAVGGSERGAVAYGVSKAGMNMLGHQIALRFAKDGVRCNNVIIGMMKTSCGIEPSVARGMGREEAIEFREKRVPLKGGMGDAWDTANAVLWLASDESKFVSGTDFIVDGAAINQL